MKNLIILIAISSITGLSMLKGAAVLRQLPPSADTRYSTVIPSIGRVQVLNGCGSGGSARVMADFLRRKHFDVKNIGNADNWNFPQTMVISRVSDTSVAAQVAAALTTTHMVLIRTSENLYDVTVIVGPDYRERMQ
jgi:hypothetical protein